MTPQKLWVKMQSSKRGSVISETIWRGKLLADDKQVLLGSLGICNLGLLCLIVEIGDLLPVICFKCHNFRLRCLETVSHPHFGLLKSPRSVR